MLRSGSRVGKRRVVIPNIKHVKLAAQNAEAKAVMSITRNERRHLRCGEPYPHPQP